MDKTASSISIKKNSSDNQQSGYPGNSSFSLRISYLLFLLMICSLARLHSQTNKYSFDYLSIKEGLPADGAYDIIQDQQGYIWMSTLNGLVRYDGYQYDIYRAMIGDSTGLMPVGRSFVSLLVSRDSMIWASTLNSGFCYYDPNTERFHNFPNLLDAEGKVDFPDHYLLFEDSQQRIWMYGVNPDTKEARIKNYDPKKALTQTFELGHKLGPKAEFKGFISEDKEGQIWAHDANIGIYRLDNASNQFTLVLSCQDEAEEALYCSKILHLRIDKQNQLWLGTDKGLKIYDINSKKWLPTQTLASADPLLNSSGINYSYEDKKGNNWVFLEGKKLIMLDTELKKQKDYSLEDKPLAELGSGKEKFIIRPVMEDEQGVWFMNDVQRLRVLPRKFFHYQHKDENLTYYNETFFQPNNKPNEVPVTFLIDNSGIMWIGNRGAGINRQNTLVQRIDQWDYTPTSNLGLSTDTILSVKEDLDQQIWIMGYDKIMKFHPDNSSFSSYQLPKKKGNQERVIFKSFEDDGKGNLWIGSNKGLYKFDKISHEFRLILSSKSFDAVGIAPVLIDQKGELWVKFLRKAIGRDYGRSLGRMNTGTNKLIEKYDFNKEDPTGLVSNFIREVKMDSKGRIWVGTFGGLCRYNPATNSFTQFKHKPADSTSISNNLISFIHEDSKSNIWIGTFNHGVNLYQEGSNNFRTWKDDNGFSAVLTASEGKDGSLWFGTYRGEGLFKMDPNTRKLSFYNKQNGLASDVVNVIVEDDYGYLWIPSESGISRFDPKTETVSIFNEVYGFPAYGDADVPQYALPFKAKNGDIWINSFSKLIRIQPQKLLQSDPISPKVHISSLKIGTEIYKAAGEAEGALLDKHISLTKSLSLSHTQNDLTFGFVGLHYARPANIQYSYKLENFDADWSEASFDRKARYAGIPPGNYSFRVRASNADGVWNEEGASIQIIIAKAWWETAWAYLVYFILLAIAVRYLIRWRTRKQEQKIQAQELEIEKEREISEKLKVVDQLKDQFLANTSHELRTPLNGIIGLSEGVYDRAETTLDREDLELIISSGKRLHNLVDDILDFSKLKSSDFELELKALDLSSMVDLLIKMNKAAIRKKPLTLINDIPEKLVAVKADPQRLEQIFHNLIGNAIKFTEEGEVRIAAELVEDQVKIWVKDTGPGIPKEKQAAIFDEFQQADGSISRKFGGTGLGLSITKRLVELHGGAIGVESKVGKGSKFWFSLHTAQGAGEKVSTSNGELSMLNAHSSGQSVPLPESMNGNYENQAVMPTKVLSSEKLRILIVDDEPVNQRVMKSHLKNDRFELAFADDGDSALKIMENSPMFDLVLLDVMMPNMSGYEVCKKIREKHLPSELPVIMVTAKNQVTDLVQGLNKGANDYLAKPFSKQEFLARVRTQIDLHHIFNIADRFIPNEFIRTLGHDRITEVQLGDLVERVVSVLFTDIRSYTTLSEAMSPEDNFRFINGYTNRMGPVIQAHRGFVNQYLGDGIMAIFQYRADDALNSMIDMQIKLREYNEERIKKDRPALAVGMGLHTGPLIMGIIGDSHRTDAATISDTVNTSARMEGLTKVFGVRILISGNTYAALEQPENYEFRYIGRVNVKGKHELIEVYECIDGDPAEEYEMKKDAKDEFAKGVSAYYEQRYEESIDLMEKIIQENPLDKVAQYFHQKNLEAKGQDLN